jgi:hypothetical protein
MYSLYSFNYKKKDKRQNTCHHTIHIVDNRLQRQLIYNNMFFRSKQRKGAVDEKVVFKLVLIYVNGEPVTNLLISIYLFNLDTTQWHN